MGKISLIAIGSSTGGVEALATILTRLRPPLPPIVIVQHIPAGFSRMFALRMDKECFLNVKEGENGELLRENFVYIAPGGLHMKICKYGDRLQIRCFMAPPAMREKGALTLGQDESTSAVYGMPKSAFDCGAVMRQVPLGGMALTISALAHKK